MAAGLFALASLGAIAFAYFEPVQVLPRIRLAPGYALTDQHADSYTSETARGEITLYTFAPTECGTCDHLDETMATVRDRVEDNPAFGDVTIKLVSVALDETDPAGLQEAAARSGADGDAWRWIGGTEDQVRLVVGTGFRRFYEVDGDGNVDFDPSFVLVDGNGIVRGEYRYQTLADDADKIVSHLEVLTDEVRYSKGAAAVAYEAAHLFLCYP